MKKITAALLILTAALSSFAKSSKKEDAKLKVVTTIFPSYDWTRQILGEKAQDAELTFLLDKGVDLHSYQPTVQDIAKISNADIFIYTGGESDGWVKDVLKSAKGKNLTSLNLIELLGDKAKEEEIVEGMQAEEECDDEEEEETEYDEHVWLSLKNARFLCSKITNALCEKDAAGEKIYRANFKAYDEQLASLDALYEKTVADSKLKTVVFADRFPFRYLVDDYGIKYYAAFVGCSAETEASFKTIIFLSEKVNEHKLNYVFQIETGDGKLSRTVIQNSRNKKAGTLVLNSMQSVSAKDIKKGTSYLETMQKNLEVLKTGLN